MTKNGGEREVRALRTKTEEAGASELRSTSNARIAPTQKRTKINGPSICLAPQG